MSADPLEGLVEAVTARVLERVRAEQEAQVDVGRWVTIAGLADWMHSSVGHVRHLRARGLPARRVGKRLLFSLDEVSGWLESQERV